MSSREDLEPGQNGAEFYGEDHDRVKQANVDWRFLMQFADYGLSPYKWPEYIKREAAVSLYRRDERTRIPTWMADAISDELYDPDIRGKMVDALACPNDLHRLVRLGDIVERALTKYPLDTIAGEIEENHAAWLEEATSFHADARQDAYEAERERRLLEEDE